MSVISKPQTGLDLVSTTMGARPISEVISRIRSRVPAPTCHQRPCGGIDVDAHGRAVSALRRRAARYREYSSGSNPVGRKRGEVNVGRRSDALHLGCGNEFSALRRVDRAYDAGGDEVGSHRAGEVWAEPVG